MEMMAMYCKRMQDSLALYQPLPAADAFHKSKTYCRLVVGSNRAGKTLCASTEFARVLRGRDPYKKRARRDLRLLAVGKDGDHIGQVMWKKLWWPGAFQVVPDEISGLLRAVRLDPKNPRQIDPIDWERQDKWMPSPPLIPPEDIRQIAWEAKNQNIPRLVTTANGSEALFHSSKGSPRQGIEVDMFWLDEEIENKDWISESFARLLDRGGTMMASFTPQASTPAYFELHKKVLAGSRMVEEFNLTLDDNPFISDDAKAQLYESLCDDQNELDVRYYGKWAILGRLVYPEFSSTIHIVDPIDIPRNWMILISIDPGAQFQAAGFFAVPPSADQIHCFDEVYIQNSTAKDLAECTKRVMGNRVCEVFIMDYKAGAITPMGHGHTIADHYEEEWREAGLRSRITGSGFIAGMSDVAAREQSLKRWLKERVNGQPKIVFHRGKTTAMTRQVESRYYSKTDPGKREKQSHHDLCDVLEYMAAYFDECLGVTEHSLYYRIPEPPSRSEDPVYKAHKEIERRFFSKARKGSLGRGIVLG